MNNQLNKDALKYGTVTEDGVYHFTDEQLKAFLKVIMTEAIKEFATYIQPAEVPK
jgi:hypothetical protein